MVKHTNSRSYVASTLDKSKQHYIPMPSDVSRIVIKADSIADGKYSIEANVGSGVATLATATSGALAYTATTLESQGILLTDNKPVEIAGNLTFASGRVLFKPTTASQLALLGPDSMVIVNCTASNAAGKAYAPATRAFVQSKTAAAVDLGPAPEATGTAATATVTVLAPYAGLALPITSRCYISSKVGKKVTISGNFPVLLLANALFNGLVMSIAPTDASLESGIKSSVQGSTEKVLKVLSINTNTSTMVLEDSSGILNASGTFIGSLSAQSGHDYIPYDVTHYGNGSSGGSFLFVPANVVASGSTYSVAMSQDIIIEDSDIMPI